MAFLSLLPLLLHYLTSPTVGTKAGTSEGLAISESQGV